MTGCADRAGKGLLNGVAILGPIRESWPMIDDPSASGGRLRGFSMSLPMSLLRAREAAMQHFRPMLRSHGMTEQQWRVMRALASKRTVEFSELVDMTFLLAPSMSRILKELENRKLIARQTNLISQRLQNADRLTCTAKIRYNHAPQPAVASVRGADEIEVEFDQPQSAITPGQALVLYDGDVVLGGGWIDSAS